MKTVPPSRNGTASSAVRGKGSSKNSSAAAHPRPQGRAEDSGEVLRMLARLRDAETNLEKEVARNADLERQLYQSREVMADYADQYDFAPVGFATLSPKGAIMAININGARMLGRPRADLINMPFMPFVARDDFKTFLDHMRRCTTGKARVISEVGIGRKEATLQVELLSAPVLDTHRDTTVYRTAIVDITKRRIAENALQENERRYRSLVDLSPDAIWVHCEGRFVVVNPAAAELLGAGDPGQILEKSLTEFINLDPDDPIADEAKRLGQGPRLFARRQERSLKLIDSTVDVEMSASEFTFEGLPAVMVIARDITQSKRAGILLRQAEERFSKAFHASPAAISIATLEHGRFIDVNNAFLRMYGFQRGEVIGHTVLELKLFPKPGEREKMMKRLRMERSIQNYELKLRTKTGGAIDVLESLELVELAGEPCVLTIWEDITERRRLEKEILQISEREQSRVGRDLHDGVCQNLAGIAFLVEGLAKNLETGTMAPAAAAIEMRGLANYARETIADAHNLATGLYPVRIEENGLMSALEELAADTTQRFHTPCIFVCPEAVAIRSNDSATHLYRIAQEAVGNAVKHACSTLIKIELVARAGQINLTVEDNGRGFAKAKKGVRPGMGLKTMLYRTRMIAGRLEVRPAPIGTIVRCTFPRQ